MIYCEGWYDMGPMTDEWFNIWRTKVIIGGNKHQGGWRIQSNGMNKKIVGKNVGDADRNELTEEWVESNDVA